MEVKPQNVKETVKVGQDINNKYYLNYEMSLKESNIRSNWPTELEQWTECKQGCKQYHLGTAR